MYELLCYAKSTFKDTLPGGYNFIDSQKVHLIQFLLKSITCTSPMF